MGVGDYWIGLGSDAGVWTWDGPQAGTLSPLPWAVGQPSASDAGLRAYVTVQSETLNSELATVNTQGASHSPSANTEPPALLAQSFAIRSFSFCTMFG